MKTGVNIVFVPWTDIISLRFEYCIGKVLGLCACIFNTSKCYLKYVSIADIEAVRKVIFFNILCT